MTVCLNGEMVEDAAAHVAVSDRGFTLGDGLFETIAVKGGAPRRLEAHFARLREGAAVLGLKVPYSNARMEDWIRATAAANSLSDAAVRLTLSRGTGARGVAPPPDAAPTLVITASPMPAMEPAAVIVARETRRNEHSPLSRLKTLNYLDSILARREAEAADADDAILLNTAGRVAESTAANVAILLHGGLVTPPVREGALPGVARADLIARFRAEERPVTLDDLKAASEVFLVNALGVRPVLAIDGTPVGDGQPGLITTLLASRL